MAAIDQTRTEAFDLCWARGDNNPVIFTVKDSAGVVIDISSWTLSMAVNTEKDPTDTVNELLSVAGIFVTDGTDGKISFTPKIDSFDSVTAGQKACYDVNRLTPSVKTLVKGSVLFIMDVDKS